MLPEDCVYNRWVGFSRDLDIIAADDSLDNEILTKNQILNKVEILAVKSNNTLVSQVQFFQMGQKRSELTFNYLARFRGAPASCNFTVKCTSCKASTSCAEKILSHQLVRGLLDANIQEKILSKAADNETELTLHIATQWRL